jgi:hypothetical protein
MKNLLIALGAIAVTEGVSVALLRMGVATAQRSVSRRDSDREGV